MSTAAPRKCSNCGANATDLTSRFCGDCGSVLPADADAAAGSPLDDKADRFAALAAHADTAHWMSQSPRSPSLARETLQSAFALLIVAIIGIGGAIVFATACPPMGLLPLAVGGVIGYSLIQQLVRTSRTAKAPLRREPTLVVDERTSISGGGQQSSARTRYFVTLELPNGARSECEVGGAIAGQVTRGDMGVAFLKGDHLIEFGRVPV